MIKLFVTDIDGCLLEPMTHPNWDALREIMALIGKGHLNDGIHPAVSICTGRPMPYAEAVGQLMGISGPLVFESAGVFNLADYEVTLSDVFDDEAEQQVGELKQWMRDEVIPATPGSSLEFSKRMDAGLIHPKRSVIEELLPRVRKRVDADYPRFEVHHTDVSINVILADNNKARGIQRLADLYEVDTEEMAYIGDSSGDIPGLKIVGRPFAPVNATDAVKEVSEVLPQRSTEAVLEALQRVINENKKNAS